MSDEKDLEDVRAAVAREVVAGFRGRDDVIAGTIEQFADELDPELLERCVPQIYDEQLAAHREAQQAWPAITDCDKLDAAFDALDAGIMARHDWWCCQNCGHAAMPDERDRVAATQPASPVRGYGFYHNQDTEAAAEGHGVFLAYGAVGPGNDALLEVARTIVAALTDHGLMPQWNGSADKRIRVPMTWQRRARPSRWCG